MHCFHRLIALVDFKCPMHMTSQGRRHKNRGGEEEERKTESKNEIKKARKQERREKRKIKKK